MLNERFKSKDPHDGIGIEIGFQMKPVKTPTSLHRKEVKLKLN